MMKLLKFPLFLFLLLLSYCTTKTDQGPVHLIKADRFNLGDYPDSSGYLLNTDTLHKNIIINRQRETSLFTKKGDTIELTAYSILPFCDSIDIKPYLIDSNTLGIQLLPRNTFEEGTLHRSCDYIVMYRIKAQVYCRNAGKIKKIITSKKV